jgi:hypothetical protein
MSAILDVGSKVLDSPNGSGNTSGTSILMYPRQLATCHWVTSVTTAPSAACTFNLGVGTTQGGSFTTISSWTWPVGETAPKQVAMGLQGNMAWLVNNQSLWVKCTVTTAGTFSATSWLTKPGNSVGMGSKPGSALAPI